MTTINLSDSTLTDLARMRDDLGFKSSAKLIEFLVEDGISRRKPKEQPKRWPSEWYENKGTMSKVLELPPGSQFTAKDIAEKGQEVGAVSTTLHYLHRSGKVGLLSPARRVDGKTWAPAVFVRRKETAK
jgi:hypothetical protein